MSSKLREALEGTVAILEEIRDAFKNGTGGPRMWEVNDVITEAKAALAEPLRNCDVGTAEEQTERFKDLCRKYRRGPGPRANCKGCPIQHESPHVGCTFAWAQMPYESEVKR